MKRTRISAELDAESAADAAGPSAASAALSATSVEPASEYAETDLEVPESPTGDALVDRFHLISKVNPDLIYSLPHTNLFKCVQIAEFLDIPSSIGFVCT